MHKEQMANATCFKHDRYDSALWLVAPNPVILGPIPPEWNLTMSKLLKSNTRLLGQHPTKIPAWYKKVSLERQSANTSLVRCHKKKRVVAPFFMSFWFHFVPGPRAQLRISHAVEQTWSLPMRKKKKRARSSCPLCQLRFSKKNQHVLDCKRLFPVKSSSVLWLGISAATVLGYSKLFLTPR